MCGPFGPATPPPGSAVRMVDCAAPCTNHALRTIPPPDVAPYARMHDDAVSVLLCEVPPQEADHARAVATLPAALGGLGLLSAARTAPAAYWAGWADALPVLRERLVVLAEACACFLADGGGGVLSLQCAAEAAALLQTVSRDETAVGLGVVENRRSKPKAGTHAPHGGTSLKEPARLNCGIRASATGAVTRISNLQPLFPRARVSADPFPGRLRPCSVAIRASQELG